MAKVRVPKDRRPPKRFKAFRFADRKYRVIGIYRVPRIGEIYWSKFTDVFTMQSTGETYNEPRVILERVK